MFKRFRRLRLNETLRNLVQETTISKDDFIYPLFVREGNGIKTEISSMPGVYQMSIDEILKECEYLVSIGFKINYTYLQFLMLKIQLEVNVYVMKV
jgi:porphobilinogen synthase